MTTLYRLRNEPSGAAYGRLIESLLEIEPRFGLVWQEQFKFRETAREIREQLQTLLVGSRRTNRWPGTQLMRHHAIVETYHCDALALPILRRPGSLFSWVQPKYPEDLHFLSRTGEASVITVAHEHEAWIASRRVARIVSQVIALEKEDVEDTYREIFGLRA